MAFFLSIKRSRNKGNLSVRCKHPVCISGNISSSGISSKVGSPASSIQINSYLRKCISGNVCSIWPSYRNIRRFPMRKLNNFSILIFQGNFRTISHRFESSFSYGRGGRVWMEGAQGVPLLSRAAPKVGCLKIVPRWFDKLFTDYTNPNQRSKTTWKYYWRHNCSRFRRLETLKFITRPYNNVIKKINSYICFILCRAGCSKHD